MNSKIFSTTIKITGDKKRKRDAKEITWSTKAPKVSRLAPENIMRKPEGLSDEAKAAVTEGDIWCLFFTEEILEQIVDCTNQKIEEEVQKMSYSDDRMKKSPYITTTDKVNVLLN